MTTTNPMMAATRATVTMTSLMMTTATPTTMAMAAPAPAAQALGPVWPQPGSRVSGARLT